MGQNKLKLAPPPQWGGVKGRALAAKCALSNASAASVRLSSAASILPAACDVGGRGYNNNNNNNNNTYWGGLFECRKDAYFGF